MIRLLRISHHELRYRWVKDEYVERPSEGQHSALEIFTTLLDRIKNDRAQLIRTNLLFPTGNDAQEIIDAHLNAKPVLRFASYGTDLSYRMITAASPDYLITTEKQIEQLIKEFVARDSRNVDGHPYIAEVFFSLE